MNVIDKMIGAISPHKALQRETARVRLSFLHQIKNYGYSEGGASYTKKSMRGWTGRSSSPQDDIDENLNTLRSRSRQLFMNAPIATSAIKTNRTNVVGQGLKLKSRIDYKTLGLSEESAQEWKRKTEREFSLWAESKFCDATRVNNFYGMQQLALISWMMNGDCFAVIKKQNAERWFPYSLRVHLIEADRVSTPNSIYSGIIINNYEAKTRSGNKIYSGVEIDKNGTIIAYHICNKYKYDVNNDNISKWTRVEAFGKKTGNQNVLQLMESERCEQYRGVPYLSPVIESLKQISRYTEAELTAAVVTAFFTAFIKQVGESSNIPFGASIPEEERVDDSDSNSYELGAGTVNVLGTNEDVVFADPKRPSSGFEPFVDSIIKQIGSALEIPYELLAKSFKASYSASRGALLEAWKAFRMRRTWLAEDFCQPIYELWLSEAVARGRINAPGFFNDPIIKKAWCTAEWIGPAPGQLDPVKEANGARIRVENGFSTREREATEINGTNFDENIAQLTRENKLMSESIVKEEGLGIE